MISRRILFDCSKVHSQYFIASRTYFANTKRLFNRENNFCLQTIENVYFFAGSTSCFLQRNIPVLKHSVVFQLLDKRTLPVNLHVRNQSGNKIKLSNKEKIKNAVAAYGSTVIVFHVSISLLSLGICYLLISRYHTYKFISTLLM